MRHETEYDKLFDTFEAYVKLVDARDKRKSFVPQSLIDFKNEAHQKLLQLERQLEAHNIVAPVYLLTSKMTVTADADEVLVENLLDYSRLAEKFPVKEIHN